MKRYESRITDQYKKFFEDVSQQNINKSIVNITNIVSRRLGKKIIVPSYTMDYENSNGKYTGVRCIVGDNEAIRFNWKLSGNSANVESISFWMRPKENPDLELNVGQESLIKLVDIIVDVFKTKQSGEFIIEKASLPKVNKFVVDSINTWKDENYQDNSKFSKDLENERTSDLYNDYTFWYNNLEDEEANLHRFISRSSFIHYIGKMAKSLNITNKFSRKVVVRKASKEIMKVNKGDEKKFKDTLYHMSLEDKMEMVKMGVVAVIKGYSQARLYLGKAGVGKSTAVKDQLDAFNADYVWYQGVIKNARSLYQILYQNNKKNRIIVLDDIDQVLKNKEVIAVLKAATDNKAERLVTFADNKITPGSKKYKDKMNFIARIIIISNQPKSKIDKAILSRTAPIEIDVDVNEMSSFIRQNIEKAPPPVPVEWKMEVWEFLNDEIGVKNIKDLDFRLFSDAVLWKASSPDSPIWKKFVAQIIR